MSHPNMYKSRVNQPDRVFLNSSDDPAMANNGTFSGFQANYATPILGVKRTQLLRATIPNAPIGISIPVYSLVFWYYKLPTATTMPTLAYLHNVRLLPQDCASPLAVAPYNIPTIQYLPNPTALVALLNTSCASADPATLNPYFIQNDILFAFNTTTNQITFTGAGVGSFYCPAGYNDPIWQNAPQPLFTGPAWPGGASLVATFPYQVVPGYTMALRCGYGLPTTPTNPFALLTNYAIRYANPVYPNSFPNLVYSQCVYLYANIIAGSSLGSANQHNLLAVVPSNAPALGVINYTVLMSNWLMKVAAEIYEISITMFDDANQPFILPDNAQVNLELAFYYRDD